MKPFLTCATVREGTPCIFKTPMGCLEECEPVIDRCYHCDNIILSDNGNYCKMYIFPKSKWKIDDTVCPNATHIQKEKEEKLKMLNPLKASKRGHKAITQEVGGRLVD